MKGDFDKLTSVVLRASVLFSGIVFLGGSVCEGVESTVVSQTTDGNALSQTTVSRESVRDTLLKYVDRGEIAGAISMVSISGKVDFVAVGLADPTTGRAFDEKSLFWVASMSKGICGAAVMSCVDRGLVSLDDSIEKYIPEIARVKVAVTDADGKRFLRTPNVMMTLRMCLSHVAGFPFDTEKVKKRGIPSVSLAENARDAVECSLEQDPLTKHRYSNIDINLAARVVEIVSGMAYEDYLQKAFFNPLGMKDITFFPSVTQMLNKVYVARVENGKHYEDGRGDYWASILHNRALVRGEAHANAAGGLFSTAGDMMRFYMMLANDGKAPDGTRILSHASILELSMVQYPALDRYTLGLRQYGDWFGHDGALQTEGYANWKENRAALLFVQMTGKWDHHAKRDWRAAALGSLGDCAIGF